MSDDKFTYCPICQLPLKAISISPDAHVSMCMGRNDDGDVEDCPQGLHCLSTDVFHYRDYGHKLLAAYRSSSDFVPPNVEIKPSPKKRKTPSKQPKRSSPRKQKTPGKSDRKTMASDSESDSEVLVQTKRPRRCLKLNEEHKKISLNKSTSNTANASSKKTLRNSSNKSTVSPLLEKNTKTAKENCENVSRSQNKNNIDLEKSSVVNVTLNADEELRFTKSRAIKSLSSLSVSTSMASNLGSDSDSESTSGSSKKHPVNPGTKIVLKEPVLTLNNFDSQNENLSNSAEEPVDRLEQLEVRSKEPVLTIERLKIHDRKLNSQSKMRNKKDLAKKVSKSGEIESDVNGSFCNTDFDDIIPGSMLDKELIKNLEKKLYSRGSTSHSCSEYNGTSPFASTTTEDAPTDGENDSVESLDPPSSPEVRIPQRKSTVFLSSSSDSDIPLSKLVTKKPHTALNKITGIKGKVKGGKVLRTPNKPPPYLNGSSLLKTNENNATSDKESDSGKSSAHTDVSFVPSEKSGSSQQSDSALSAQSTDQLTASSKSSSYTSSESYTESRSSDPSYSEESDVVSNHRSRKTRDSPKRNRISPKKRHLVKPLSSLSDETSSVHSSSSSSEISIREKLLFGRKKQSPKKYLPKSVRSPVKIKQPFKASTLGLLDTTDSDDKSEWQTLLSKMRSGCYPSDLKIDSEDSLTMVSSCSSSDTSHASTMLQPRQCPFYKRIPDTPFAVDAFQYWNIPGVKVYFLSHFHSDHYIGLKKSFAQPIYCTRITANLVRMKLRVDEKWLRVIELDKPQIICGVEVTALDANHCPGSVMFLFSLTNGQNYLHVGDFRASKAMTFYPSLRNIFISKLFLDTTYCSPQYCFPTQEEVIAKVVEIVRNHVKTHPRTLVVCGSYTIGKEKVFLGVAEALDWRVWARPEKQRVFSCLNDPRINARLIKDCRAANVHVLSMASLQIRSLQQHLESCTGAFTHVIGIKPTGWELNAKSDQFKVTTRDNITIYGVPYSEHSSFTELRDFAQFLQPREIVPTVNMGNVAYRNKMSKHFSEWLRPPTQTDGKTEKQMKVSNYFKAK